MSSEVGLEGEYKDYIANCSSALPNRPEYTAWAILDSVSAESCNGM